MARSWLFLGSLFAGLAVAAGAFAAHGLDRVFVEKYAGETRIVGGWELPRAKKYLDDFRTGAEYQMTHALALLAVGLLSDRRPSRWWTWAGGCFTGGILLFSGSLYLLTTTGITRFGAITPIGGTFFLVGWLLLAIGALRTNPVSNAT